MIIDIHSHIRMKNKPTASEQSERELISDMQRNNVDYRIVSSLDGSSVNDTNLYISDFVSRYSGKLGGCAVINPKEPDCEEKTRYALNLPGMVMLELNSFEHGYYPDVCDGVEKVLKAAEKFKVPVKIFSGIGSHAMPQQWICHVKKHPDLIFIFLHMGCFDYGYGCVDLAVKYPNIYLETSNQYEVQILKKALSIVSGDKLLFGSSYPERLTKCSADIFDMFNPSETFRHAWLSENAEYILKLKQQ